MVLIPSCEISRRRERGMVLQRAGNIGNLPQSDFAVLSTFNVDLIQPYLMDALERVGLYSQVHLGRFGQVSRILTL